MPELEKEAQADLNNTIEALRPIGVDLAVRHDTATVSLDGRRLERRWLWLPRRGAERLRRLESMTDLLVIGRRIPVDLASHLRESGHWYADSTGAVYVRAEGLVIDVRGHVPARGGHSATGRPAGMLGPRNLMSARRAQVIFCLLVWAEMTSMPTRYIAECSGVSTSIAHDVLSTLEERRYLTPDRRTLIRRDELVDQWTAAFPLGLGRAIELGRFIGDPDPIEWTRAGHRVVVSGEQAAPGLHGQGLTLYVQELDPAVVARSRWRRTEEHSAQDANIVLRRKFWRAPDHWGPAAAIEEAPDLLVYADLLTAGDPRQREAAMHLRNALA